MSSILMPAGAKGPETFLAPQRCGNCRFAAPHPNDPAQIMCQGAPPTPIVTATGQDPLGRPVFHTTCFWPTLPKTQRQCALWKIDPSLN